jgi:hypothetical protein
MQSKTVIRAGVTLRGEVFAVFLSAPVHPFLVGLQIPIFAVNGARMARPEEEA